MKRLVPYIRTADGAIQRLSDRIYDSCGDSLEPYVYKQNLIGWPESRVFSGEGIRAQPGRRTLGRCLPD